jgi:hypothetical protein
LLWGFRNDAPRSYFADLLSDYVDEDFPVAQARTILVVSTAIDFVLPWISPRNFAITVFGVSPLAVFQFGVSIGENEAG